MAFNTYIGDVIAIVKLGEEIWRLGWSDRSKIEPAYNNFYECVQDWDRTAKNLQRAVALANQQEPFTPRGNHLPSITWSDVFDEGHFLKAIDDHKKVIEECYVLLRHTQKYLPRKGPVWQMKFNLQETSKFEDLTRQITSQTSRLQNLLKPLELGVLIDIHRKVSQAFVSNLQEKDIQRDFWTSASPVYQQTKVDSLAPSINQSQSQIGTLKEKCADSIVTELRSEDGEGGTDQTLQLLWQPDGTIQLEIATFERQERNPGYIHTRTIDLNTRTTRIIPLYAGPDRDCPLSLRICDNSTSTDVQFSKLKDLLRLQQAATEYEVYDAYSQGPVEVTLQFTGRKGSIQRKATLQFWLPKRLGGRENGMILSGAKISDTHLRRGSTAWSRASRVSVSSSSGSTTTSSTIEKDNASFGLGPKELPTTPLSTTSSYAPVLTRFHSEDGQSSASSKTTLTESVGSRSIESRRASEITRPGSASTASTTRRQSVNDGTRPQSRFQVHREPQRPMLVLLMHGPSSPGIGDKFSIITVEIDRETESSPSKCGCKSKGGDDCPHVTIKRSTNGHLLAQNYEASSLEDWDVTLPGMMKRMNHSIEDLQSLSTLSSMSITFAESGDPAGPQMRKKFAGYKCGCKNASPEDRKRCIGEKHQGNFGTIKKLVEIQAAKAVSARTAARGHFQFSGKPMKIGGGI